MGDSISVASVCGVFGDIVREGDAGDREDISDLAGDVRPLVVTAIAG